MPWSASRGLAYLAEIRQLQRDHPGLHTLLMVDKIFWKRLDQRLRDDRTITFEQAYDDQLREWDAVRNTAVTDVRSESLLPTAPAPARESTKDQRGDQGDTTAPLSKRAAKRAMQKGKDHMRKIQRIEEQAAGKKPKGRGKGKASRSKDGSRADNKVPGASVTDPEDFRRLDNVELTRSGVTVCKFFQLRSGCKRGADCKYVHECAKCPGVAHAYCDHH